MKLLTLNTHSLVEGKSAEQVEILCEAILCEGFDVIALQEVNQPIKNPPAEGQLWGHCPIPCQEIRMSVKEGNFSLALAQSLTMAGAPGYWCYLPMKVGYGKYDEGLSLFCRTPIVELRYGYLTERSAYDDWKTRMALGVRCEGRDAWFWSLHTGWWEDAEEPFREQWRRLLSLLPRDSDVWLMGDFNQPAERCGEGAALMRKDGFYDAYELAERTAGDGTASGMIDGWRGRGASDGLLRLDQIRTNRKQKISSCRTLFDGERYAVISDHFGVAVTVED